jgi:hypothetical protein
MTWTGSDMKVITRDSGAMATSVSGNFVVIITTEGPGAFLLEDGFVIIVSPDAWEAFLQALERGEPFRGDVSEDRSPWELEWVE